jgi:ABC-type glycerol-3-phosphate transport system substrate-binding protein
MGARYTEAARATRPAAGITRRRFLRVAGAGSLALAGAGLLAACGTSGNGNAGSDGNAESGIDAIALDQPVEIGFWHIQATLYGEAIKEIVAKFNRENPHKITVKEIFQGDYGALNQKIRAALQGGGLPEVSMAYESDTLEYMKTQVVLPLDNYIASKKYGLTDEQLKDVSPGVLERQRIPAYQGKTMSWIHGNSAQGLYFNKDILKQAGIAAPAKSWDEFLDQARQVKANAKVPALPVGSGPGGLLQNIVRSNGVAPLADDGQASNFNAPEVVVALELLKRLFDEGLAYTAENTEQEFTNGRAAFEIGTTARTSSKIDLIKDKFPWGITLTPQGKAPQPITTLYGGNQVLFDRKDPQRNLAGWLFMRYFGGAEAQAIYAARTGYFPATLSAKGSDLLRENYQQYPQKQQAFDEVFPAARIYQPSAAGNSIDKLVSDKTTEVILGKTTPADAAAAMKREADRMLKELAS